MHRRIGALLTGALTVAVLATSCSSGTDASGSKPSANSAAPSVSKDSSLHDQLPPDIKNKGSMTVATDATIGAPFASFAPDNKTIVGLNVDMAQALAQTLGVDLTIVNTPFGTLIPGLQAKRYDFSVSVMLDTKLREKSVDFVDYIMDGSGFLVRTDDKHTNLTLADICGMKVAAITGSVELQDITKQDTQCRATGKQPVQISAFAENAQGILALTSRRVDVWTGDSDQNAWLTTQNNGQLKQSGKPFDAAIDGIAMPKGSDLVPVMQKALQKLMDDGGYLTLLKNYGIEAGALTKATINNAQY